MTAMYSVASAISASLAFDNENPWDTSPWLTAEDMSFKSTVVMRIRGFGRTTRPAEIRRSTLLLSTMNFGHGLDMGLLAMGRQWGGRCTERKVASRS